MKKRGLTMYCSEKLYFSAGSEYHKMLFLKLLFKGKCKKVIGIDIDRDAKSNPFIDEFFLVKNNYWPLDDKSVDVCICDNVLEHLENPEVFFSECRRVIKQGGYLCIRTPNILSYFGIFARLIPNQYHTPVISKVQNASPSSAVIS